MVSRWNAWNAVFYMENDFYAGQFTKTCYPKFKNFNTKIAHFFISHFNKFQQIFQGVLVRDFEKTFSESIISLPVYTNGQIAFDFMEAFIKAVEKDVIKNVILYNEIKLKAYEKAINENAEIKR